MLRKTGSENPAVVRAMVGWESVIIVYLYPETMQGVSVCIDWYAQSFVELDMRDIGVQSLLAVDMAKHTLLCFEKYYCLF